MEQRIEQDLRGVELQIWREDGGAWRCRVLTTEGDHVIHLDDQAALSTYIASQIDLFVGEYERAGDHNTLND